MEDQIRQSHDREVTLNREFHSEQLLYLQVTNEYETARYQAQEWLAREGHAAQGLIQTYQQELRGANLLVETSQREHDVARTRDTRTLEEKAMEAIKSVQTELGSEQQMCREMSREGTKLVEQVSSLTSELQARDLDKARRELDTEIREKRLEDGTKQLLEEMANQVAHVGVLNKGLALECRESTSERESLEHAMGRLRTEFEET
eukprot:6475475-Amphidinium_carterae.1